MNRGNIKIKETEYHRFVVEVETADGNLWLTKHEIADLFNVTISSVSNSLHAIFKSGLLKKEDVSRIHLLDRNGKQVETILYNLEVLIFISCRIASFEANAFRKWGMKALRAYSTNEQNVVKKEVLITHNPAKTIYSIINLN